MVDQILTFDQIAKIAYLFSLVLMMDNLEHQSDFVFQINGEIYHNINDRLDEFTGIDAKNLKHFILLYVQWAEFNANWFKEVKSDDPELTETGVEEYIDDLWKSYRADLRMYFATLDRITRT